MPILTFLIYNGFKKDLEANEVFKRLLSLTDQTTDNIIHLEDFLAVCMVKANSSTAKALINHMIFMQPNPVKAKAWVARKFKSLYPIITAASTLSRRIQ